MSINEYFFTLVAYVFLYYFTARNALIELKSFDPGYFNDPYNLKEPVGMATSIDIGKMLFDFDLPKKNYKSSIKRGILMARILLVLFLPIAIGLAFFIRI